MDRHPNQRPVMVPDSESQETSCDIPPVRAPASSRADRAEEDELLRRAARLLAEFGEGAIDQAVACAVAAMREGQLDEAGLWKGVALIIAARWAGPARTGRPVTPTGPRPPGKSAAAPPPSGTAWE